MLISHIFSLQLNQTMLSLSRLHLWLSTTHFHINNCLNVFVLLKLYLLQTNNRTQLQTLNLLFQVRNRPLKEIYLTLFTSQQLRKIVKDSLLTVTTTQSIQGRNSQQRSLLSFSVQRFNQSWNLFLLLIKRIPKHLIISTEFPNLSLQ